MNYGVLQWENWDGHKRGGKAVNLLQFSTMPLLVIGDIGSGL